MFITPREYLDRFGRRACKSLGQHFLIQPRTARRIVEAVEIEPGNIVVEIGPGLGSLTKYLIEYPCCLHLVELDRTLAEALQNVMPQGKASITWHIKDILDVNWHDFIMNSPVEPACKSSLKIVGNIPYGISSPLLFHLIKSHEIIERAVFMVQREVGLRWTAEPSSKDYGIPTVILKNCAETEKLFAVGHGQFVPPPRVESLVVRIKFFDSPGWAPLSYELFHGVVSELFRQRRKTILNGLKSFLSKNPGIRYPERFLTTCLEKTGISASARPEELSPEDFVKLAKCLSGIDAPE